MAESWAFAGQLVECPARTNLWIPFQVLCKCKRVQSTLEGEAEGSATQPSPAWAEEEGREGEGGTD